MIKKMITIVLIGLSVTVVIAEECSTANNSNAATTNNTTTATNNCTTNSDDNKVDQSSAYQSGQRFGQNVSGAVDDVTDWADGVSAGFKN